MHFCPLDAYIFIDSFFFSDLLALFWLFCQVFHDFSEPFQVDAGVA
jgi:predicted metalloprotease